MPEYKYRRVLYDSFEGIFARSIHAPMRKATISTSKQNLHGFFWYILHLWFVLNAMKQGLISKNQPQFIYRWFFYDFFEGLFARSIHAPMRKATISTSKQSLHGFFLVYFAPLIGIERNETRVNLKKLAKIYISMIFLWFFRGALCSEYTRANEKSNDFNLKTRFTWVFLVYFASLICIERDETRVNLKKSAKIYISINFANKHIWAIQYRFIPK